MVCDSVGPRHICLARWLCNVVRGRKCLHTLKQKKEEKKIKRVKQSEVIIDVETQARIWNNGTQLQKHTVRLSNNNNAQMTQTGKLIENKHRTGVHNQQLEREI